MSITIMRLLWNNIFNNFKYAFSSEDDLSPISNMFNYQTLEVGKFKSVSEGSLTLSGSGIINETAVFNTNADKIRLEITNKENKIFIYNIDIIDKKAIHNIAPIDFINLKITFIKEKADGNNIECGYLILGEGVDFPVHDKQKTHTVNYTHNQYFSLTGHYFYRKLPFKSYDTWKVSFPYLTNDDREKIINFFDISNFDPFVLQVWTEETISPDEIIDSGNSEIETARYNISKYGLSKYGSSINAEAETIEKRIITKTNISNDSNSALPKYYMKSGLYVCTNEKIDFKKSKNDLYQYSAELTFREVR